MFCKDCGGTMVGDGHTLASQCEFASSVDCVEPDSGPHYCGFREERHDSLIKSKLLPIETAPKDGQFILLFGDSGYTTTPLRCEVCHYDAKFRPKNPWVNYAGDAFTDSGKPPTHWCPLPE